MRPAVRIRGRQTRKFPKARGLTRISAIVSSWRLRALVRAGEDSGRMIKKCFACAWSWVAVALMASAAAAQAQSVADFYKGKTVTIVVGSDVGGGYDLNARAVARFIGRHIP